ncbi:choline uptake/conversion transcriptional regulator CudC [Salibacterium sp. K-3]
MTQQSTEAKLNHAENEVIDAIAETMDLYGITPSIGRLYATMYFKHEPMTLDEMKDELGMTKPSMSTAVRSLQDIQIVRKTWQKGSRKDHFMAEKDFFNYFTRFFGIKWKREADMNLSAIHEAQAELRDVINDENIDEQMRVRAKKDLEQLNDYQTYCHWLQKLVGAMESGEIFNMLPIDDDMNKINEK